jgi:hypothetical protein
MKFEHLPHSGDNLKRKCIHDVRFMPIEIHYSQASNPQTSVSHQCLFWFAIHTYAFRLLFSNDFCRIKSYKEVESNT